MAPLSLGVLGRPGLLEAPPYRAVMLVTEVGGGLPVALRDCPRNPPDSGLERESPPAVDLPTAPEAGRAVLVGADPGLNAC